MSFTGREEMLALLHERLSAGTTAVLPEALHGLAAWASRRSPLSTAIAIRTSTTSSGGYPPNG
ncbi:hypothetical protein [Nonomuraea dietziae]|uniref:hypothetical protein n=1 Tax=Nonomuraea dietziae TaxID=65515 RepID=UPI0031DCDD65